MCKFQSPCGDQIFGNMIMFGVRQGIEIVSVPLRGLDIRKLQKPITRLQPIYVSVPLRGLDIRKHLRTIPIIFKASSFSPLAGIRYSETIFCWQLPDDLAGFQSPCGDQIFGNIQLNLPSLIFIGFSPLAGIRYSETFSQSSISKLILEFQSPCGDQIFGN